MGGESMTLIEAVEKAMEGKTVKYGLAWPIEIKIEDGKVDARHMMGGIRLPLDGWVCDE